MDFAVKVREAIEKINPKLEELAEGHVELRSVDPQTGKVIIRLIGGKVC